MSSNFFEKDPTLQKFLCVLIIHGKKNTAKKIIKDCGNILKKEWDLDPQISFHKAIDAVKPALDVRSVRKGGTIYQVPVPLTLERRIGISIRWIIQTARKREEPTMAQRLAHEIQLASNFQGKTIERRNQLHALAEANRAFAHMRWK